MVGLFFRVPFFAHSVQPFPLEMLYKPLPRQFLLNFDGKLLIKLEFIAKNNALHIFLSKIQCVSFYHARSENFVGKINTFFYRKIQCISINDVPSKSRRKIMNFEEKNRTLCSS